MNIGFSLHSPWPSSEIFRMFPYRMEVMKSLLCCDLISFHLFEYARSFYMCAARILDLRHTFKRGGILGIEYYGRFVSLRVQHIGVEITDIRLRLGEEKSKKEMDEFKKELYSKTKQRNLIFSSVDRNHVISGLTNKLTAYLQCLDNFPRIRNSVCLVQYVDPYECPQCF